MMKLDHERLAALEDEFRTKQDGIGNSLIHPNLKFQSRSSEIYLADAVRDHAPSVREIRIS